MARRGPIDANTRPPKASCSGSCVPRVTRVSTRTATPSPPEDGEVPSRRGEPLSDLPPNAVGTIVHVEDRAGSYLRPVAGPEHPHPPAGHGSRQDAAAAPRRGRRRRVRHGPGRGRQCGRAGVALSRPRAQPVDRLSTLRVGESREVVGISPACQGPERRRLLDLGLVPGTEVTAMMRSPTHDPSRLPHPGARVIALRQQQADMVKVRSLDEGGKRVVKLFLLHLRQVPPRTPNHKWWRSAHRRRKTRPRRPPWPATPTRARARSSTRSPGCGSTPGTGRERRLPAPKASSLTTGSRSAWWTSPGTYSLLATSYDEEIARDFLLFGNPDVTIIVVDATRLHRNLNLVLQVLEITDRGRGLPQPDWTRRSGTASRSTTRGSPNCSASRSFAPVPATTGGCPSWSTPFTAVAKGELPSQPVRFEEWPDESRGVIRKLTERLTEAYPDLPNAQWVALRMLDGDERIAQSVLSGELLDLSPTLRPRHRRGFARNAGRRASPARAGRPA